MNRRRALMSAPVETKNRFAVGDVSQGNSRGTVAANGDITVTYLGWGSANRLLFPFEYPISITAGDVIRIANTKTMSGNPNSAFINGYCNTNKSFVENKLINTVITSTYNYTATEDFSFVGISVSPQNGSPGSFSWHSTISVNDVVVIE